MNSENPTVSISKAAAPVYPAAAPFDPPETYPEYPFRDRPTDPANQVYPAVREALHLLHLDDEHFETPQWNPLRGIVRPGDRVLLKPNFVLDRHPLGGDLQSVITHGSVLRPIVDYALIALEGKGEIVIADAPLSDTDFDQTVAANGTAEMVRRLKERGVPLRLYDLRAEKAVASADFFIFERRRIDSDPCGYRAVNLGTDSELYEVFRHARRYRGSDYDAAETIAHHHDAVNEYYIAGSILAADVVISVPKLKTHCKVGTTLNLKNMIGINGDKNWIPHYRVGAPCAGGDEFPENSWRRAAVSWLKDRVKTLVFSSRNAWLLRAVAALRARGRKKANMSDNPAIPSVRGSWYGNDTVWRSAIDINKILLYADEGGVLHETRQRRFFSVIDGIVGGEADGPLYPKAAHSGVVIAGADPVAVDAVASFAMGFAVDAIPLIARAAHLAKYPLGSYAAARVASNVPAWNGALADLAEPNLHFTPPTGWQGHLERQDKK
jgi:uncharacterized protein (DUF362 family)